MTEWALFIGLKLLEIGTVVFVPWGIGSLFCGFVDKEESHLLKWAAGFFIGLIVCIFSFLGWLIWTGLVPAFINLNWILVERIMQ